MAGADADLPTLPSGYFNSPDSTHWSWKDDFNTITEIGKGKVGGHVGGQWPEEARASSGAAPTAAVERAPDRAGS